MAVCRRLPPGDAPPTTPRVERRGIIAQHVEDDGVETADGDKRIGKRGVDAGAGRDVGDHRFASPANVRAAATSA